MTDLDNAYVEALKTIANSKRVKELCEPNIMSHEDVKENIVVRLLYARKLLETEIGNR